VTIFHQEHVLQHNHVMETLLLFHNQTLMVQLLKKNVALSLNVNQKQLLLILNHKRLVVVFLLEHVIKHSFVMEILLLFNNQILMVELSMKGVVL